MRIDGIDWAIATVWLSSFVGTMTVGVTMAVITIWNSTGERYGDDMFVLSVCTLFLYGLWVGISGIEICRKKKRKKEESNDDP